MSSRNIEQGIEAIQQGKYDEGARLIRFGLKDESVQGQLRAIAFVWLAETTTDNNEKISYYNNALTSDPNNQNIKQRLDQLMAANLPPIPQQQVTSYDNTPSQGIPPLEQPVVQPFNYGNTSSQGMPSITPQQQTMVSSPNYNTPLQQMGTSPRTVGILNGPNGPGTGFFATRDGILITTRFVVGGLEKVRCEIEQGHIITADVVRSFPRIDLAIIHTGFMFNQIPPVSHIPNIADNSPLSAFPHKKQPITGIKRETKSRIPPDWFPTTLGGLPDSGGHPIYNDHGMLIGMLTNNTNRTSAYVFGLNMHSIYHYIDHYRKEINTGVPLFYCPSCGGSSRAGGAGGHYCEICGSIFPRAKNISRFNLDSSQHTGYYAGSMQTPCTKCRSRIGFYNNSCLRCGHNQSKR